MPGMKYIVLTYRTKIGLKYTVVEASIHDWHKPSHVQEKVEKMMRQAFDKSYGDWVSNIVTPVAVTILLCLYSK